ncbi:hypothetical protein PHJA_001401300 [Phtheirospermum japonicum]|uniref:KIB1-4 beta-propeller domain-containing protein n=1 Tax=Phtheirospermum japonicum TaxID=374723 RepID=A0A830CE54_9LAMI|nr:hypothetical protein PHJA_001401300 [Phtheirospermum japonicum]
MVSLVYRLKGSATTGILRFPFLSPFFYGRAWMISSAMSSSSVESEPQPKILSAPWLMLPPPVFKAGSDMKLKFYNLAEDRLESFGVKLPNDSNDAAVLVGSSHGWLAFFNQSNNHLFLSNPLSDRHLKLPPIDTLPNPEINLRDGCGTVSKVILSCSPDDDEEEECRAMMSFGPGDSLAFCLPGRSPTHWTPIGKLFFDNYPIDDDYRDDGLNYSYGRAYEDFVYCSRRKLFSCITEFVMNLELWEPSVPTELEDWDLCEPSSPRSRVCYRMSKLKFEGVKNCSWLKENKKLLQMCIHIPYLVFAEQSDQLFIVTRFINVDPYKTVGFSVLKVDYQNGLVDRLRLAGDSEEEGGSLGGLAMFIGLNHSFAVSAAAELGLKPNSIYFTDAVNTRLTHPSDVRCPYHSHGRDSGIFDYGNKTLSPLPYYKCSSHDDQALSTPMWFTPSW